VTTDSAWMRVAVDKAREGLGRTAPNPSVGAVLVRDGVVIGLGHTQPAGGPHAEVMALADARRQGFDPRGATLYSTLEPCRHHGRTPPCTDAILAAGIARVVVGVVDPFPEMRGKSVDLLRGQGVEVALGVEERACADLIVGFARAMSEGLPEVTLKVAMSLDGAIATVSGESQWITGEPARERGHALRSDHDAVLVGIGTALADNPRLTCRLQGGHDPVPVVLDTELRLPSDAALLSGSRRAVICCAHDAPERDLAAEIVRVPRAEGGLDLRQALSALAARGLHRVLVEGGAGVHRSLLQAGLVDHLVAFVAPVLIPGGRVWTGDAALQHLSDALRFEGPPVVETLGQDVALRYRLVHRGGVSCSQA